MRFLSLSLLFKSKCRKIMGALTSRRKEYNVGNGEAVNDVEKVVCKEEDLRDGEMREVDMGQSEKVLLVKENGTFTALGNKCTHYGAPLVKGDFSNGIIRCPWHGACFNSITGDIEDFPGLDSLPCYDVRVVNGDVIVKASATALKNKKRTHSFSPIAELSDTTYVIVGGGAAGQSCVETLRKAGFNGKIILVSKEKHPPYDRPKLSKALDMTAEDLCLRNEEFFRSREINLMLQMEVTDIDTEKQWVSCQSGNIMVKYNKLMIATGGSPITLDVPGKDLKNVCMLRTPEDGNYIAANSSGKDVVIIGTSFIGMEVASYLLTKARSINVIGRNDVPFSAVFGEKVGTRIKKMFEEKGVIFHSKNAVTKFVGNSGTLTGVELSSGDVLKADVCIVGIGVKPATEFVKTSSISMNNRGHIYVNNSLESSAKNIYACGDIVEFPLSSFNDQVVNISHWQMAQAHGRAAALNMLGQNVPLKSVPFFWSVMCGKSFRYAGYGEGYDDVQIEGDLDKLEFSAYFCKGDNVVAICTVNRDPLAAKFASVLRCKSFSKDEISKFELCK